MMIQNLPGAHLLPSAQANERLWMAGVCGVNLMLKRQDVEALGASGLRLSVVALLDSNCSHCSEEVWIPASGLDPRQRRPRARENVSLWQNQP